jgi:hypothetical protein
MDENIVEGGRKSSVVMNGITIVVVIVVVVVVVIVVVAAAFDGIAFAIIAPSENFGDEQPSVLTKIDVISAEETNGNLKRKRRKKKKKREREREKKRLLSFGISYDGHDWEKDRIDGMQSRDGSVSKNLDDFDQNGKQR